MGNFTPLVIPSWLCTMVMVIPHQLGAENWIPSDQKWLEHPPFNRNVIILLDISYVIHVFINFPGQYHVIRNIYRCVFPRWFCPFSNGPKSKTGPVMFTILKFWAFPTSSKTCKASSPCRCCRRTWLNTIQTCTGWNHGIPRNTTDACWIGNNLDLWWSLFRGLNCTQFGKNKGFLSMPSSSNSGKVRSDQGWTIFFMTHLGDQKWQFDHYNKYTYMD